MSLNLYNIEKDYLSIISELEQNGGDLTPELSSRLEINKDQLEKKATGYVSVIKKIENDNNFIDAEISRLNALKKINSNITSRLKDSITTSMILYEIDEIKTPLIKINFRKSESVEIFDINLLPPDCKIVEVKSISKTEIKKMIKQGKTIQGAAIVENINLQIK
jgi:hypothetical protein